MYKDKDRDPRKNQWNYRQVIGMLNYLSSTTRSDISMATHQCARFCEDPKALHELGVRHLGKHFLGTKGRGIIFEPNKEKCLEYFMDAGFAGGWQNADASNPENVLLRTGYIIFYADCPVVYIIKLRTEIALSTAEFE